MGLNVNRLYIPFYNFYIFPYNEAKTTTQIVNSPSKGSSKSNNKGKLSKSTQISMNLSKSAGIELRGRYPSWECQEQEIKYK